MNGIPVGRVLERLDEYLGKNDYNASERHLQYWLSEALSISDDRGAFAVTNELVGLYRKCGNTVGAKRATASLLMLVEKMGIENEVGGATAYLNVATTYKFMNDAEDAVKLYEKARVIYERELKDNDTRLGGLYNNMALALTDLSRFDEAEKLYHKAISVMEKAEFGELEVAITYLNLAELKEKEFGLEKAEAIISSYLDVAEKLLFESNAEKNGYFAFVCEKCVPSFDYYGRFLVAKKLSGIAEKIYEENKNDRT